MTLADRFAPTDGHLLSRSFLPVVRPRRGNEGLATSRDGGGPRCCEIYSRISATTSAFSRAAAGSRGPTRTLGSREPGHVGLQFMTLADRFAPTDE